VFVTQAQHNGIISSGRYMLKGKTQVDNFAGLHHERGQRLCTNSYHERDAFRLYLDLSTHPWRAFTAEIISSASIICTYQLHCEGLLARALESSRVSTRSILPVFSKSLSITYQQASGLNCVKQIEDLQKYVTIVHNAHIVNSFG
jgi:hypothetical protein